MESEPQAGRKEEGLGQNLGAAELGGRRQGRGEAGGEWTLFRYLCLYLIREAQIVRAVPGCQGAEWRDGEHRMLWESPLEPLVAASVQVGTDPRPRGSDPVI